MRPQSTAKLTLVESNSLFSTYALPPTYSLPNSSPNSNPVLYYGRAYHDPTIRKLHIQSTLQFNQQIFHPLHPTLLFPQHFLQVHHIDSQHRYTLVDYPFPEHHTPLHIVQAHKTRLSSHLKAKLLETEARKILHVVIKCTYSLFRAGFYPRNIRSDQFVLVDGVWKMDCVVPGANNPIQTQSINSPLLWNNTNLPPQDQQCDPSTLNDYKLQHMVVWDIGIIFISMLCGSIDKQYLFRGGKLNPVISKLMCQDTFGLLKRMLHLQSTERMTRKDMNEESMLCEEVARLAKKDKERSNVRRSQQEVELDRLIGQFAEDETEAEGDNTNRNQDYGSTINANRIDSNLSSQVQMDNFNAELSKFIIKSKLSIIEEQSSVLSPSSNPSNPSNNNSNPINNPINNNNHSSNPNPFPNISLDPSFMMLPSIQPSPNSGILFTQLTNRYKFSLDRGQFLIYSLSLLTRNTTETRFSNFTIPSSKLLLLMAQYSVQAYTHLYFLRLQQTLIHKVNIFEIPSKVWLRFTFSATYQYFLHLLRQKINKLVSKIEKIRAQLADQSKDLVTRCDQRYLLGLDYAGQHTESMKFRSCYYALLRRVYDLLIEQQKRQKDRRRLGQCFTCVVYCRYFEEIYIQDRVSKNLQLFLDEMYGMNYANGDHNGDGDRYGDGVWFEHGKLREFIESSQQLRKFNRALIIAVEQGLEQGVRKSQGWSI